MIFYKNIEKSNNKSLNIEKSEKITLTLSKTYTSDSFTNQFISSFKPTKNT